VHLLLLFASLTVNQNDSSAKSMHPAIYSRRCRRCIKYALVLLPVGGIAKLTALNLITILDK
jgi:hypothetical protein